MPQLERYVQAFPDGSLARIMAKGTVGTLRSTLPYFTAPAWTTFMTGLNPSEHGVFHWRGRYDPGKRSRPLLSSRSVQQASFWSYCQSRGIRVSVTNFPMEYPAPPTVGAYVCGTLAPEEASDITWPPSLGERIRAEIPGYRFEMDKGLSYVDRPDELRNHILEVGKNHAGAALRFGDPGGVGFFFHVVTIVDRMQHFFWDSGSTAEELGESRSIIVDPILDAYKVADDLLTELLAQKSWRNVLIVSDHGFGPSHISFHSDRWLVEQGWATWSGEKGVDFQASLAYAGEEPECAIYVNRVDRDGCGLIPNEYNTFLGHLRSRLMDLRLPNTNSPVFQDVHSHLDLPSGQYSDLGPDVVLVPAPGVHPSPGYSVEVFGSSTRLKGGHRREGIFMGWGPDFCNRDAQVDSPTLDMIEMFPLMCALMGLPVPSGLSGRVPGDILSIRTSLSTDPNLDWRTRIAGPPVPQDGDSASLLRRLEELGYL